MGQSLSIIARSRSYWHTRQSVGLLWTSDKTNAENSIWRHTTLATESNLYLQQDSNPQSQQASGHWDRDCWIACVIFNWTEVRVLCAAVCLFVGMCVLLLVCLWECVYCCWFFCGKVRTAVGWFVERCVLLLDQLGLLWNLWECAYFCWTGWVCRGPSCLRLSLSFQGRTFCAPVSWHHHMTLTLQEIRV
jgi:hypothetical protein